MNTYENIEDLRPLVGGVLGTSEWLTISQERIQQFADATGDQQWIHVDVERASKGPFGRPIAHGFLTLSLLPILTQTAYRIVHCSSGVNYGLNKVRFPAPVPVGSRLRAVFRLLAYSDIEGGAQIEIEMTIEKEGGSKPVCIAESIIRRFR